MKVKLTVDREMTVRVTMDLVALFCRFEFSRTVTCSIVVGRAQQGKDKLCIVDLVSAKQAALHLVIWFVVCDDFQFWSVIVHVEDFLMKT